MRTIHHVYWLAGQPVAIVVLSSITSMTPALAVRATSPCR
jgi:hypothetical protein